VSTVEGHKQAVDALVVGEECLLSSGYDGAVLQWPLPDPKAIVKETKPQSALWLRSPEQDGMMGWISCMQVRYICH
jgi:hypothetical protein